MISKKNFIAYVNILKQLAFLTKTASLKAFVYKYFYKSLSTTNFKNSFINKVSKSYTQTINSVFVIVIITCCISAIGYSYYEQKNKFNQDLLNKSKALSFQIEKLINNYKYSMEAIAQILITYNLLSKDDDIIQTLKLSFTEDEHLKLLPLTFYFIKKPYRSFSAYGISTEDSPDLVFINKLEQNSDKLIFYYKNDKRSKQSLTLNLPLYKPKNNFNHHTLLLGYLSLPINVQTILESINDDISNENLLKIIRQNETNEAQYLIKQENTFKLSYASPEYRFADAVSVSNAPYLIAIGSNKKAILQNTLRTSAERCSVLLSVSIIMLLSYNFLERKRTRKQCNELFTEEVSLLNQKIDELTKLNSQDNNKNKKLIRLNNAIKTISTIEAKIKQERDKTIDTIQDSLKLKGHKNEDELTMSIVQTMFEKIYKLSEDLKHNIVSIDSANEIDLNKLVSEITPIFSPITEERNINLSNEIKKNITLKTNELTLKQILISLIARSLYFIPEEGKMIISASQDKTKNRIIIEIKDNGISLDEALFRNTQKNHSLFEMTNIQLDSNTIENLVKERFKGSIQIDSDRDGNQISILLPIELNEDSKVIPMPLIGVKH